MDGSGVDDTENTVSAADDGTGGADLTPSDNTDTIATTIDAAPDLTITKDDGLVAPASVVPGDTITYALEVANTGTQDADGVVITLKQ